VPDAGVMVPGAETCVLSAMLDRQAAAIGDRTLIVFDTGESWTYAAARDQARRCAAALARLGIRRGDPVLVWLPNGPQIVRISFALSYLGAVFVPVNVALRGGMLEHIIANSGARIAICHASLIERLGVIKTGSLDTIVAIGGAAPTAPAGLAIKGEDALESDDSDFPAPVPPVAPWDTAAIFYTSGTTGPSKGVICPNLHIYAMGPLALRFLTAEDRFLINLPFFHLAGALIPPAVIGVGASMAMMTNFHTATFWTEVRRLEGTACYILSTMSSFLMKRPAQEDDADNPMRCVVQQPLAHDAMAFAKRFGVSVFTQFDMTEMGPPIVSEEIADTSDLPNGYCGRLLEGWPHFEARIVDDNDVELPAGAVGELVVRSAVPWVVAPGYHRAAEATAKAWRNGWFHTGDALVRDASGNFAFVDRIKDSIRRRGENISSSELEAEVLAHPNVAAAAAVAVRSEHGEDEVLIVVQAKAALPIDPQELTRFLIPRLPHFAVPRYVRVVDAMPLTPTNKIQKNQLRAEGIVRGTWDREAAGTVLKRDRLQSSA